MQAVAVDEVLNTAEDVELLPLGWIRVPISDVARLRSEKADPRTDGKLPFVGMDDIEADGLRVVQMRPFSEMRSLGNRFRVGDMLYGRLRPYLNKTATVSVVGACSGELLVFEPTSAVHVRYLQYFMHSRRFVLWVSSVTSGDRPRISFDVAASYTMPLPPFAEQKRIVVRIDALFAEIEEGEAALASARKGLETFRRALLKSAVTGDLTKDWRAANPPTESGQDLLTRISRERATAPRTRVRRSAETTPFDTSALPHLPESWVWSRLDVVGEIRSGQTPKGIEGVTHPSGGIPWFKVSSMNSVTEEQPLKISEWNLTERDALALGMQILPVGAICFPKRGGSILTNKKRRLGTSGTIDLNMMAYIPHEELSSLSWLFFLNLDLKTIFDGSNVPQINYGDVAYLPIPIPPPSEAAEILRRVSEALSAMDDTRTILDAEAADAARLKQSILKSAFEGRLVPQDPNDEPATALLARLADNPAAERRPRGRRKAQAAS